MDLHRREFASLLIGSAALAAAGKAQAQGQAGVQTQAAPLASWNEGPAKEAILKFVRATTDPASPTFLPPDKRIAAFDQDGTLWVEQPLYTQAMFCLDRVPALVKARPELKERKPFSVVLSGDRDAIAKLNIHELFEILLEAQSGMTVETFRAEVRQWLATAKHPRWNKLYTELVYQPMIELMTLLRANGFINFIATGGSASFVREYSTRVYDILPQHVSGSAQAIHFSHAKDGTPILSREPKFVLDNLEAGKIENFWLMYGQRPKLAFGNSSGDDQQMLEYVNATPGAHLAAAVLHDDATREYAYGPAAGLPDSNVGTFSQAMYDMALKQGWLVVSMKRDWKRIFAFED